MRLFLASLFLFILSTSSFGQEPYALLGGYNFDEGGYYLLGMRSSPERNKIADSLGEWFIDDIATLNKIKKEWVFATTGEMYACGYHYRIYLCKDGKKVNEFSVNLYCKEMLCKDGYYFFDPALITSLNGSFKHPKKIDVKPSSLESARAMHDSLSRHEGLLWIDQPDWVRFEGSFKIKGPCPDQINDCFEDWEIAEKLVIAEIQTRYPGEEMDLQQYCMGDVICAYVHCNKSLADKFDMEEYENLGGWGEYILRLRAYLKE